MLRECDAMIGSQDEQLSRLRDSIARLEAERQLTCDNRDKARRVLDTLRGAAMEGHQLRSARVQPQNPHLSVVPDSDGTSAAPTQPEDLGHEAAALPAGNPVILVEGERSVVIMKVISTDGERYWSVKAVTDALGESADAVRRNRSVMQTLHDKGVLARKETTDGEGKRKKKVLYRLAASWQAA